jgi:hypothetical protein
VAKENAGNGSFEVALVCMGSPKASLGESTGVTGLGVPQPAINNTKMLHRFI